MKMQIPSEARWLIDILEKEGYEAYVVGGCVRDSILKRAAKDWDLCSDCPVDEIVKIFKKQGKKVIPTGIKHGTATIIVNNMPFEMTTYRIEKNYMNHRRPERVEFTKNLREDLKRRDFTINAMAYCPENGLVDLFEGQVDLKNKKIRCVGNPEERFTEDALRILRGVRFATELDFNMDEATLIGMKNCAFTLEKISRERIRDEWIKILMAPVPSKGLRILEEIGALSYIIPELHQMVGFNQYHPYHDLDLFEHTLKVLDHTKPILIQRLGALLHDVGKLSTLSMDHEGIGHFFDHNRVGTDRAGQILNDLRLDHHTIDRVKNLVREHTNTFKTPTKKAIKRLVLRVGKENVPHLFDLQEADQLGHVIHDKISGIEATRNLYIEIINNKEVICIKDLKINGKDLINIGIPQGPKIKTILDNLLEEVLENNEKNNNPYLLKRAREISR